MAFKDATTSPMPQNAMVLAAGLGTRMAPLTNDRPKPLIEVSGTKLIDYTLDRFARAGIAKAVVNVHYFADMMEEHLAQRAEPAIAISNERNTLMETGGGLVQARGLLGDAPIYCSNTDAILVDGSGTEACRRLAEGWRDDTMDALLLIVPTSHAHGIGGRGDFDLSPDGRLHWRTGETAEFVFTGLQILHPRLFADAPCEPFSTRLLWEKAHDAGRLCGVVHDGHWLHVGDPQGLEGAEAFFRQHDEGKATTCDSAPLQRRPNVKHGA